jgi:hypothetical protein
VRSKFFQVLIGFLLLMVMLSWAEDRSEERLRERCHPVTARCR